MPRRHHLDSEWAVPLVRALPLVSWARGRTKGTAQTSENLDGEAQPRLTSGGEAATTRALSRSGYGTVFQMVTA